MPLLCREAGQSVNAAFPMPNDCWWTIAALVHRPSLTMVTNIGIFRRHRAQKEPDYLLTITVGIKGGD